MTSSKNTVILALCAALLASSFDADATDNVDKGATDAKPMSAEQSPTAALGVTAGLLSGIGFSYRAYDALGDAHHVGGVVYGDENMAFVSTGFERLYRISSYEQSALYWYWGISLYYTYVANESFCEKDKSASTPDNTVTCSERASSEYRLSAGPGLSFEYGLTKGLSIAAELPLALSVGFTSRDEDRSFSLYPIPSIVLQYRL